HCRTSRERSVNRVQSTRSRGPARGVLIVKSATMSSKRRTAGNPREGKTYLPVAPRCGEPCMFQSQTPSVISILRCSRFW
ncbi:hypothetical protein B0H12DRAFT_1152683, partial [Mycena haematopus]